MDDIIVVSTTAELFLDAETNFCLALFFYIARKFIEIFHIWAKKKINYKSNSYVLCGLVFGNVLVQHKKTIWINQFLSCP